MIQVQTGPRAAEMPGWACPNIHGVYVLRDLISAWRHRHTLALFPCPVGQQKLTADKQPDYEEGPF